MMHPTMQTYISPKGAAAYLAKEAPHENARNAQAWALLEGLDLQGKIALDMGCGFGRDTAEIRRRGATCWGVDVSPPLLYEAQQRYGGTQWCQADMLTLHTPPAQPVDFIWSAASLVHVPHEAVEALVTRWVRWLNPGGYVGIITKAGVGQRVFYNLGEDLPRVMVYHTLAHLRGVLEGCGAKVEHATEADVTASGEPLLSIRARYEG